MNGLYIHIPFCHSKCGYCDFYSITQLELMDAFVEGLRKEIHLRAPQYNSITFNTLFWGGGTPTLLPEKHLQHIRNALFSHFNISPDAEITIEANPGTLSPEKLALLRSLGFNRLSMGVQSFNPGELEFLGRIHTVADVLENFQAARNAGFRNINIDLMTAFPGITESSFKNTLQEAVHLFPEHISCYTLIFEPGTVFYKRMEQGELQPLGEDEEAGYYEFARDFLNRYGYQGYEISNFSRGEEFVCRHNLIYWQHHPYIGLGPSAHSFYQQKRFSNKRSVLAYLKDLQKERLPIGFVEELSLEKQMFEFVFLRLRLRQGIPVHEFKKRFGVDFFQQYDETLQKLMSENLIEQNGDTVRLSEKGWMIADTVAAYF